MNDFRSSTPLTHTKHCCEMIKTLKFFFIGFLVTLTMSLGFSQSPDIDYETCPVVDYINYFDTTSASYIPTPTEIQLGQARVLMKNPARCTFVDGIDMYIPTNRPGWAIALAHTHRIMTNFMGADVFNINYLHGACFQESTYKNGSYGETWPAVADHNVASALVLQCGFAVSHGDGYFHTDANGRIFVSDMYGTRFPTNGSSANLTATFEQNVHLAMFWINAFYRVNSYGRQLKMKSFFMEAADPLASTKITAGSYVSGQLLTDVEAIVETNRTTTINAPDLLQYITNGAANNYATSVSGYTEALSTPSDIVKPAFESTQHSWYDQQIEWQDVSDYIDQISVVYIEADAPTIKAHVKTVFDAINGGASVSFRYEFSPVIDAITGSFPYYEPEIHGTQQAIYQCNYDCSLAYPIISYDTPLEFCEGLSVELTSSVGDYTYQWYKDNDLIPGAESINYFATESGVYSVVVTNADGCSLETNRKVEVKVTECSTCSMTVEATPEDVTCSGYGDGSIAVTASGVSGPFTYQVNIENPQSSSTFGGLTEGNYFIEVVQVSDPTCKGFASAVIDAETVITNTIALDSTIIDCETVLLNAEVVDLPPSQCTYKFIRESSNEWGSWPYTSLTVSLKDGDNELYNTRALESVSTLAAQRPFEVEVSVPNGANLSIEVTNASSSGTSHGDIWTYKIVAPDGDVIASTISPGTYPSGKTVIQTPVTAICKFDRPTFTYDWTPQNVLAIANDTTATVTVATTTLVKITATNVDDPSCPLKDSVYISNTCNGNTCTPATQASISSTGNVNAVCDGNSLNLSLSTDQTGYDIQWTHNGTNLLGATSATYAANDAGTYTVIVSDPADPACSYESAAVESFNLTVNSDLTPSIAIEASETNICANAMVNLSINTQEHEGASPSYEWFINGDSEGTGMTLNTSNLTDGDVVTCELTSSESCATTSTVLSNEITFNVTDNLTPSISILSSAQEICTGDPVNFSIDAQSNEGNSPVYDWLVNGASNSNGTTLSLSNLQDGDEVSLQLTSSETCVTANGIESDPITINVLSNVTPSLTIATTGPTSICINESVDFEVTGGNGLGSNATYDWYVNGTIESLTPSATITINNFQNGDEVTAIANNLSSCATTTSITSDPVVISIISPVTPTITIEANNTSICNGATVDFSIDNLSGEGANPSYQWLLNNSPISGATESSYQSNNLTDNDEISLALTVEETCVTTSEVTSTAILMTVGTPSTPVVEITANNSAICPGETVDFSISNISGEGASPSYSWTVNGTPTETSNSFSSSSLGNNDVVRLALTSSLSCVTSAEALSNEITITTLDAQNLDLTLSSSSSIICTNETVTLEANSPLTSGASYQWFIDNALQTETSSSLSVALQNSSIIQVDLSATTSCGTITASDNITVEVEQIESPTFIDSDLAICSNEAPIDLSITGISNASITWTLDGSEISGAHSSIFSADASGTYGVTISGIACSDQNYEGTNVVITPTPEIALGPDLTVQKGESISIQNTVMNAQQVTWSPAIYLDDTGIDEPIITTPADATEGTTLYTITATNGNCIASEEFLLTIYEDFNVFSSFSPNGDGVNDEWLLPGIEQYPEATVKIFNRWGAMLYESVGYDTPWDGTFNGKPMSPGTYYYLIELNDAAASSDNLNGAITIVK